MPVRISLVLFLLLFNSRFSKAQNAAFTAPDTVCVNSPVTITNTSSGASSYFWNFCVANGSNPPIGTNMGNVGGLLSNPVYIDYVYEGGNFYGFSTNNVPGKLLRLNFGSSLLNTPSVTDLGTVGGIIPNHTEGLQIVKNGGQWYVIVVGGDFAGTAPPAIVKIELGSNIANNSPVGTYWGNIGNLGYPHDLFVFEDNGQWYGLTVNTTNNTITRFDFTSSFANTPTAVNLGNIGGLNGPTGIYALKEGSNWYAFVTNAFGNTITRLNFGNSLLNTPTGVNLGNIAGQMSTPWDIYMINYCGQNQGYLINAGNNTLIKMDFNGSVTNTPTVTNYGNVGNMNFPHCLSKIFRVGADLYSFVANVNSNSITRIRFTGCTNASIPNTTLQNPPPITYNAPGTYNINLTINDGLSTQSSYCKQVVVLAKPTIAPIPDSTICPGVSIDLNPSITGATAYSWSPSTGLSNSNISNPIASPTVTTQYILTATNGGGCSVKDTFMINVLTPQQCGQIVVTPGFTAPDTVCVNNPVTIVNTSVNASTYYWSFCATGANNTPTGLNLGNPGGQLTTPCFIDFVNANGNYYGFITSNNPASLVRLDYGNSLLNTPIATNLGNFGNIIPLGAQGIQVVFENGSWYAIITGGDVLASPFATSRIIKIDFGANIANNTPIATNWGNIGGLAYPTDLYMFKFVNNWYGFTVNYQNGTITKFNFGTNFNNPPTGINLGSPGILNKPNGIFPINDNGTWRLFVANFGNNTLSRIDFGNSLLNPPSSSINLGNPGSSLDKPRDIYIYDSCGQYIGFAINENTNDMVRMNFTNLTSVPTANSLGVIGGMSSPHSISKLFRSGPDLYAFIPNSYVNTLSRIKFSGCTNASIPNSTLQNPPTLSFNAVGTYTINLTVDEGLPTQGSFCKEVVVVNLPHTPTQSYSICPQSTKKLGSSIKPATYLWSTGATTDSISVNAAGVYWVESSKNGCTVRDSFIVSVVASSPPDFSFQQDLCSTKSIQFGTVITGFQSFSWDFGNNQTNNNSQNPSMNYSSFGSYNVILKVLRNNGCLDSVVKSIDVTNPFDNSLLINSDTSICLGDSVLLKPNGQYSGYCWQSNTGQFPGGLAGYVSPSVPTTYSFTTRVLGPNLVVNPDFAAGNTGFSSEYGYNASNQILGEYGINNNPSTWNASFSNCTDHTTGSGNMMTVNGASGGNAIVWSQTLNVTPNTNYRFSTWIASLQAANPASLQFSINGVQMGTAINGPASTCQWQEFGTSWNSGIQTSAVLSIVNKNTTTGGNDYALDDIYFGTTATRQDSVRINLSGICDSIDIAGIDKVCSPTDTISYSIFKAANCTQAYSVLVDNNYAEIISQTASTVKIRFKQDGQTTVRLVYSDNCKTMADSINVDIKFSPTSINLGPDVNICRDTSLLLTAVSGFASYIWQDGSTGTSFQVNVPGTYHVTAENYCGLQIKDTLVYNKSGIIPFSYQPATVTVCAGDSVQFTASGGNQYEWQPSVYFAAPNASVTRAIVSTSQVYILHITDAVCNRDTMINIPVTASPEADISVTKTNDVSCSNDTAILKATGGVSYTWMPNNYIIRNSNNQITVRPPQSITFYVTGIDALGCKGQDSIVVEFRNEGEQRLFIPNAFSPNGDGLNDIFRPTFIGPSAKYQFSIYNRWGQLVFISKVPGVGWNGIFQSKEQPGGVYVYYITAEGGCNGKFEEKGTFVLIR